MSPTLNQKLLKFISPKFEEERLKDRITLAQIMACCEDITRTVQSMNGHVSDHPLVKELTKRG